MPHANHRLQRGGWRKVHTRTLENAALENGEPITSAGIPTAFARCCGFPVLLIGRHLPIVEEESRNQRKGTYRRLTDYQPLTNSNRETCRRATWWWRYLQTTWRATRANQQYFIYTSLERNSPPPKCRVSPARTTSLLPCSAVHTPLSTFRLWI